MLKTELFVISDTYAVRFLLVSVPTTLTSLPPGVMLHMHHTKRKRYGYQKNILKRCAEWKWLNRSEVKKAKDTCNKILYRILLTIKHMRSTWNLFVLLPGYLAVIIPEFDRSSITPMWEIKHGHELSQQTVYYHTSQAISPHPSPNFFFIYFYFFILENDRKNVLFLLTHAALSGIPLVLIWRMSNSGQV